MIIISRHARVHMCRRSVQKSITYFKFAKVFSTHLSSENAVISRHAFTETWPPVSPCSARVQTRVQARVPI